MCGAMLLFAIGYGRVFSIGPDDPLSMLHLVGFTLMQVVAIIVGLSVGGWVWAAMGKFFFGLSRSDIEGLLKTGPQIGIASRYNSWCLDALFGSGEDIKQDKTLQGRPGE